MSEFIASNGKRLTQGLFYEFQNPDAKYTLRDEDWTAPNGRTYVSMAAIYRNCVDEYEAAIKVLGSWSHWKFLCDTSWFVKGCLAGGVDFTGLKGWREEMAMRDASLAKSQLLEQASLGNVTAQKLMYEGNTKAASKAGRPEVKKPVQKESGAIAQFKAIGGGKK